MKLLRKKTRNGFILESSFLTACFKKGLHWTGSSSDMSSKARERNIFNKKIASTLKYHKITRM